MLGTVFRTFFVAFFMQAACMADVLDDLFSKSDAARQERAIMLSRQGKYDESLAILKDLVVKNNYSPHYLRDYLVILFKAGKYSAVVENAGRLRPDAFNPEIRFALGASLLKINQPHEAKKSFLAMIKEKDGDVGVLRDVLAEYEKNAQYMEELKIFQEFALLYPPVKGKDAELKRLESVVTRNAGVEAGKRGESGKALKLLRSALAKSGGDRETLFDYITNLSWAGDHKGAIAEFGKLGDAKDVPHHTLSAVARSCLETGDFGKAEKLYSSMLERNPADADALKGLVNTCFSSAQFERGFKTIEEKASDDAMRKELKTYLTALIKDEITKALEREPKRAEKLLSAASKCGPEMEKEVSDVWAKFGLAPKIAIPVPVPAPAAVPAPAPAPVPEPPPVVRDERHVKAVELARSGKNAEAAKILEELVKEKPTPEYRNDLMYVLNNAGRHAEAVRVYGDMKAADLPDYCRAGMGAALLKAKRLNDAADVLTLHLEEAPGDLESLRNLCRAFVASGRGGELRRHLEGMKVFGKDPFAARMFLGEAAWALGKYSDSAREFEAARRLSPGNVAATRGLARAMFKSGRGEEAVTLVDDAFAKSPGDIDLLYEKAELQERRKDYVDAFHTYEQIQSLAKDKQYAIDSKYRMLLMAGATSLAREKIEKSGEKVGNDVWLALLGDEAVRAMRVSDFALAKKLLERNAGLDLEARSESHFNRNRMDLIMADRGAKRMDDVLAGYEELKRRNVELPYWIKEVAGDAYLYKREPEKALALYQEVKRDKQKLGLDKYPDNFNLEMALCAAYCDLEEFDKAGKTLDDLDRQMEPFTEQRGVLLENYQKSRVDMEKGWVMAYQNRLKEADEHMSELLRKAPFDSNIRASQAYVSMYRGFNRKALDDFNAARTMDPKNRLAEVGQAYALDKNDEGVQARETANRLMGISPREPDVIKLKRELDVADKPMARVDFVYGNTQSQTNNYTMTGRVEYPVRPGRKVYVEQVWMHVEENSSNEVSTYDKSRVDLLRTKVGADWRLSRDFRVDISASEDDRGNNFGMSGLLEYTPTDHLTFQAFYDSYSLNVPGGVFLDDNRGQEARFTTIYRHDEDFFCRLDYDALFVSDHNKIFNYILSAEKTLTRGPVWRTFVGANASISTYSETTVNYYSPKYVSFMQLMPGVEHTWYRRYDFSIVDKLTAGGGLEVEKSQPVTPVWQAVYTIDFKITDTFGFQLQGNVGNRRYGDTYAFSYGGGASVVYRF